MFALADFAKMETSTREETLDDVVSIPSKLKTIMGNDLPPILINKLDDEDTQREIQRRLKHDNLVIFTNSIQSYWSLGKHFFKKKLLVILILLLSLL